MLEEPFRFDSRRTLRQASHLADFLQINVDQSGRVLTEGVDKSVIVFDCSGTHVGCGFKIRACWMLVVHVGGGSSERANSESRREVKGN